MEKKVYSDNPSLFSWKPLTAFPPNYVSHVSTTQTKQWEPNISQLWGSRRRMLQTVIALCISVTKFSLPVKLRGHRRYISWNAAAIELHELSLYLLLILCILCFWHSCHQFHHPPPHTSLPLCEGLPRKLLLTTYLSQIWCRLAALFYRGRQYHQNISCFYLLSEGGAKSQWNSLFWRANTTQWNLPTT